jgi:hypothetical protein
MVTAIMTKIETSIDQLVIQGVTIGIIYSISDLGDYMVEIRHHDQRYFVGSKTEPDKYGNLGEAKMAARSHGAVKLFLALSKTYEETEVAKDSVTRQQDKFDYMAIDP